MRRMIFAALLTGCFVAAVVLAWMPGLSSESATKKSQRMDGRQELVVTTEERDARTELNLLALRDARLSGDHLQARMYEEKLGWHQKTGKPRSGQDLGVQVIVLEELQRMGERFGDDILITPPDSSEGNPTMASRADGTLYVVTEDYNQNLMHIYLSTDGGSHWTYDFSIYDPVDPVQPSLAIADRDTAKALIAYVRGSGTIDAAVHTFWWKLDSPTFEWWTSFVDSNPYFEIQNPRICVDTPQYSLWYAYITYTKEILGKQSANNVMFSRTLDKGWSWTTPVALMVYGTAHRPDIDFGNNNVYVVHKDWTYDTGTNDIWLHRSTNFGGNWDTPVNLTLSLREDYDPRVSAADDGNQAVVAFTRNYALFNSDIESYFTTDAGNTWTYDYLPFTTALEQMVDLDVSRVEGRFHAAWWSGYDIIYTWALQVQPHAWQPTEVVTDPPAIPTLGVPLTLTVNPARPLDTQECVAWADIRTDINMRVYFDAAEWETTIVDPGGGGEFATIQAAVNNANDGNVILLQNGVYTGPGNRDIDFMGLDLTVESVSGDPTTTIIDCQGSLYNPHRGFWLHSGESPAARVAGLTIRNGYAAITPLTDQNEGGGILVENGSSPTLENLVIEGNASSAGGGGLHCSPGSSPIVDTCLFIENVSDAGGGGMHCGMESTPTVTRCTFVLNSGPIAGGIYIENLAFVDMFNSIVAFSPMGMAVFCEPSGGAYLECCDIYGNAGGDWESCIAGQLGIQGNFSLNPSFCFELTGEFSLELNSPCLPENNDCGELIGALGFGCIADDVPDDTTPQAFALQQNHPNPFNPVTTIVFALPRDQQVNLTIYSLDGRKVTTLLDERKSAGDHRVVWNGQDDRGRSVPSGTYICRLVSESGNATRRMALVK